MADDIFVLDLDADRERRSAEREGKNAGLPIRLGGRVVSTLPAEFPLDVIEPLRKIDQDLALLLRQAIQMSQGENALDATALVIDLLASNPNLPSTFLEVLNDCGTRLLGEEGLEALVAYRPTIGDVVALVKGVAGYYGFSLGEASESSELPESDGETLSVTSSGTTELTPAASTSARAKKAS
jgi:hypothetical protein